MRRCVHTNDLYCYIMVYIGDFKYSIFRENYIVRQFEWRLTSIPKRMFEAFKECVTKRFSKEGDVQLNLYTITIVMLHLHRILSFPQIWRWTITRHL